MEQIVNKHYRPLFTSRKRYCVIMGGRSGGRSFTASQFALAKLRDVQYFRCAIMRFIAGDIRNSIFQEIKDRAEEQEVDKELEIKENTLEFVYGVNSIKGIGFRKSSSDQKSKLKSLASFNCVIIEEADEVSEEDFMQLDDSLRTINSDIKIILLLNPPHKSHWIIKRFFNLNGLKGVDGFYSATLKSERSIDTDYIHTTYLNNKENLNESTIANFENYKATRPEHYYNMIMGLVSEGIRGRIYKNWKAISVAEYESMPYSVGYGLDFGFTNDPTSSIEVKIHNNKIYLRELIYKTGLLNKQTSKEMESKGVKKSAVIVADSAEPKSIEELKQEGWFIVPAEKGPDSVRKGIDTLLEYEVSYTEDSVNVAHEVQNYTWALDRNKEPTNEPIDDYNHALDAIRYYVSYKKMQTLRQPNIRVL